MCIRDSYYCEQKQGYQKDNPFFPITIIYRYFETFEEFINYRNGDLTHCDLSAALECKEDFSKYIIDGTTKLPIYTDMEVTSSVEKVYHDKKFHVIQQWRNQSDRDVYKRQATCSSTR